MTKLKVNENYYSTGESFICCDEQVVKMYCEPHGEFMGCYFCEFDYTEACECEPIHTAQTACRLDFWQGI